MFSKTASSSQRNLRTEAAVLVGEDTSRLDRTVRAEDAQNRGRRRRRRDRPNPESTSGSRLQLCVHARQTGIVPTSLTEDTARGSCDGAIQIRTLCRGYRRTIGFAEPNANGLAVRHTDVPAKAVQDVILRTNGVRLVDKVDEATLL